MKHIVISASLVAVVIVAAADIAEAHGPIAAALMIAFSVSTFVAAIVREINVRAERKT
jgi:hypothetical protein